MWTVHLCQVSTTVCVVELRVARPAVLSCCGRCSCFAVAPDMLGGGVRLQTPCVHEQLLEHMVAVSLAKARLSTQHQHIHVACMLAAGRAP
jgi:hypothetical protein